MQNDNNLEKQFYACIESILNNIHKTEQFKGDDEKDSVNAIYINIMRRWFLVFSID